MLLSSATILGALADAVKHEQVSEFGGIYDGPETLGIGENNLPGARPNSSP